MNEHSAPVSEDAERFQRVWQRVQGGSGQSVILPDAPPPNRSAPEAPSHDFSMSGYLQQAVDQAVGRAASCRPWPQLNRIAGLSRTHARRLSAALFLLTGIHYSPGEPVLPRSHATLAQASRSLYFRFRQAEAAFRSGSRQTSDGELRALFHELAGECAICCQRLRRLVEQQM